MSATDRFLTAAVAPLADNAELQLAARQQLAEAIEQAGDASGDDLGAAAQRLEDLGGIADPGKKWRIVLYLLLAIVSGLAWAGSRKFVSTLIRSQSLEAGELIWTGTDPLYEDFRGSLTPRQELMMFGDSSKNTLSECAKVVWDTDRDNPAYFSEFLTILQAESHQLPADLLPVARQLDPQNSYFTLLGANDSAKQADRRTNPAELEEAISLFHQAAAQSDFNSYKGELLRQRIALFPAPRETLDWMLPLTCLHNYSDNGLDALINALKLNAASLAESGDAPRMEILVAAWQAVCEKILKNNEKDPYASPPFRALMEGPLDGFIASSEKLGLTRESARLQGIKDRLEAANRRYNPENVDPLSRSSYATVMLSSGRLSPRTPQVRAEGLHPGLAAEHAQLARALALGGWLVLFPLTLCAALFRLRGGPLSRRLAPRIALLLRPLDFAWILGGGVIIPLGFYFLISRLTPLGSGALQPINETAYAIANQSLGLVLLLIALPLLIARWRLTRRAGAIGMATRSRILWIAVLATLVAIPLLGVGRFSLYPYSDINDQLKWSTELSSAGLVYYVATNWFSIGAVILIGLLAITLVVTAVAAAASRPRQVLRRLVLARTLAPVYATAALTMAILALALHAEEKYWVAHDTLMALSPNAPFLTRYDQQVAQDVHHDLVEIWGKPNE